MTNVLRRGPRLATYALVVTQFVLILIFVSCTSDAQRIEDANEAAQSSNAPKVAPPSTHASEAETINAFEVRDGDCLQIVLAERAEMETIETVDCSGAWDARVISSFVTEKNGIFPGVDFFFAEATTKCDRRFSYLLHPTEESWPMNDRTTNCLQGSYGMESTQLDKLNRMVNFITVSAGECVNYAPISRDALVELVNCAGDWDFKVINTVPLTVGYFPGDTYMQTQANTDCHPDTNLYFTPTAKSWLHGDRSIVCALDR